MDVLSNGFKRQGYGVARKASLVLIVMLVGAVLLAGCSTPRLQGTPVPEVRGAMLAAGMGEAVPGSYYFTVVFKGNGVPADVDELVAAAGGTITYRIPQIGVIQMLGPIDAAMALRNGQAVQAVSPSLPTRAPTMAVMALADLEPSSLVGPGDLYTQYQWDIKRVTNDGASWALGTGSRSTVVGVIDTGIYEHPDLVANLLPGSKNFVPAGGYLGEEPYEQGDPFDVTDRNGHGTHVAGTVAANGRVYGVGPNLGIRAYKVFGNSSAMSEWIWAAIIAAADDGVDVINMSLGGFNIMGQIFFIDPVTGKQSPLGNDSAYHVAEKRAIEYAIDRGVVVVAAAGNDGINATQKTNATALLNAMFAEEGLPFEARGATFTSPAGHPDVVVVSATGPDDSLTFYSNYGPGFVTVAAPGGDLSFPPDSYNLSTWSQDSFDLPAGYVFSIGTSMAAPKAAAAAALIRDQHPGLRPNLVVQRLTQSAEQIGRSQRNQEFGFGMVNAYNALNDN